MKWVEPQVFKLGESAIDRDGIVGFLRHLGAEEWMGQQDWYKDDSSDGVDAASVLIEIAGRSCYKSFGVGLNPNVTKIRKDRKDYLENVVSKGDGSVLEHPSVQWAFADVSRVFTHELVRHRAGVAISQESLRYVRQRELRMTLVPGSELARLPNLREITAKLEEHEESYLKLAESLITDGMSFDDKKAWTSALRRVLPDGIATNLVWSANHRAMRWILEMRTAPGAEVEMRYVFDKVGQILQRDYPVIFGDFERKPHADGVGAQWVPRLRSKV